MTRSLCPPSHNSNNVSLASTVSHVQTSDSHEQEGWGYWINWDATLECITQSWGSPHTPRECLISLSGMPPLISVFKPPWVMLMCNLGSESLVWANEHWKGSWSTWLRHTWTKSASVWVDSQKIQHGPSTPLHTTGTQHKLWHYQTAPDAPRLVWKHLSLLNGTLGYLKAFLVC